MIEIFVGAFQLSDQLLEILLRRLEIFLARQLNSGSLEDQIEMQARVVLQVFENHSLREILKSREPGDGISGEEYFQ